MSGWPVAEMCVLGGIFENSLDTQIDMSGCWCCRMHEKKGYRKTMMRRDRQTRTVLLLAGFRVKAFVWQLSDKIHERRGSCVGQSLSGTGIVLELEQEIRIV